MLEGTPEDKREKTHKDVSLGPVLFLVVDGP